MSDITTRKRITSIHVKEKHIVLRRGGTIKYGRFQVNIFVYLLYVYFDDTFNLYSVNHQYKIYENMNLNMNKTIYVFLS